MDVRRLLMLIFEGWYLKTNLRRGAAFALGSEISGHVLPHGSRSITLSRVPQWPRLRRVPPPASEWISVVRTSLSCSIPSRIGGLGKAQVLDEAITASSMPCQPEVCTWRPMAQTNPLSSRATATTALFFITRRAVRRLNLAFSRSCAFQAMSVTSLGNSSCRAAMIGLTRGLCW
jgi:hypothetical protein